VDRPHCSQSIPLETNGGFTRGNVLAAPVEHDYKDANWSQVQGVRAALLWQPTDALTITPTVFVQTITQGAPDFVDDPPGVKYEAHYQPFDQKEPYGDSFELFTLPIKYDFGPVELTSSSAYYRRQTHLEQDTSEIAQDFLTALIGVPKLLGIPTSLMRKPAGHGVRDGLHQPIQRRGALDLNRRQRVPMAGRWLL